MSMPTAIEIKAKKLGVLIRSARQNLSQTADESAQLLGVSAAEFLAFELGEQSPSLPQLEILAYYWGLQAEYFWENELLGDQGKTPAQVNHVLLAGLRQRMIGVLLRKARLERKIGLDELAAASGIAAEKINAYELSQQAVPLPELEILAAHLGTALKHFRDQYGPLGAYFTQQQAVEDFKELPVDLQIFVSRPNNRPFLELAQRLSEMDVKKLRSVAESLLEITF